MNYFNQVASALSTSPVSRRRSLPTVFLSRFDYDYELLNNLSLVMTR